MDLKIFVLTPDDIRLSRRIERDIAERGRTVVDVLQQYNRFVKPAYDDFIRPTMKQSDLIIPFWQRNHSAVEMLIENLKIKMRVIEQQRADHESGNYSRTRTFDDGLSPALVQENSPSQREEENSNVRLPSEEQQAKYLKVMQLICKLNNSENDEDKELLLELAI